MYNYSRAELEQLLAAMDTEDKIDAARAQHEAAQKDRVLMSDIRPGMSLAEKKRVADHILALMRNS